MNISSLSSFIAYVSFQILDNETLGNLSAKSTTLVGRNIQLIELVICPPAIIDFIPSFDECVRADFPDNRRKRPWT